MTELHTLILSTVEQHCVLIHLDTQYRRLSDIHIDKEVLKGLLLTLTHEKVVPLLVVQVRIMLRHLRSQHALLDADMTGLEERVIRGGYDGELNSAWRVLDADSVVLADVIRRLWEMLV